MSEGSELVTTFTLDTNCLIDVADERPAAEHVRALVAAHNDGQISVALVASSASERQQGGGFLESLSIFNARRTALGFGSLPLLPPIGRWNVSFFDHGLWCNDSTLARERAIFTALFPTSPPEWEDYAAAKGLDQKDRASSGYLRWRNQFLDAQAFWSHDHAGRNVFVTSDRRFRVLAVHPRVPPSYYLQPRRGGGNAMRADTSPTIASRRNLGRRSYSPAPAIPQAAEVLPMPSLISGARGVCASKIGQEMRPQIFAPNFSGDRLQCPDQQPEA